MTANTTLEEKWKPILNQIDLPPVPRDRVVNVTEWTTGPDEWRQGRSGVVVDGRFYSRQIPNLIWDGEGLSPMRAPSAEIWKIKCAYDVLNQMYAYYE